VCVVDCVIISYKQPGGQPVVTNQTRVCCLVVFLTSLCLLLICNAHKTSVVVIWCK